MQHPAPTSRRVPTHDDRLHVRGWRGGDGDGETRRDGCGEHQRRTLGPTVLPELRLDDVVGGHLGGAEHRRARHRRADSLVQPRDAVLGDHLTRHLVHGRRRKLFARSHLDHDEVGGRRDGRRAGARDEPRGDLLPHSEFLLAVAGVQHHLQRLVQPESQAAVSRLAQRSGGEAAIQSPHPLGAEDGRRLRHHP